MTSIAAVRTIFMCRSVFLLRIGSAGRALQAYVMLLALALGTLGAPSRAAAQNGNQDDGERPRTGLYWRNRPSIQLGPHLRLDLRLKLARDLWILDPAVDDDLGEWRMLRAGLDGRIGSTVTFELERDLQASGRWRDVYANWGRVRTAEVRAGRFKVPFSAEQLTSTAEIDFVVRSLAASSIAPARQTGVMMHGRWRGYEYQVGVFRSPHDTANADAEFAEESPHDARPSLAGRIRGTPFRTLLGSRRPLRIGVAYGVDHVPEGLHSLRGRSIMETATFFSPVYVNGRRTRTGIEGEYVAGSVALSGEWMQARDERRRQAISGEDLSDVIATGWYTSAVWLVTGEEQASFRQPRRALFRGGIGAVEVAARLEHLRFTSAVKTGDAFAHPRADHLVPTGNRVLTLGVNWYPNRWTRLTMNGFRERFENPPPLSRLGTAAVWSAVTRLQLVF